MRGTPNGTAAATGAIIGLIPLVATIGVVKHLADGIGPRRRNNPKGKKGKKRRRRKPGFHTFVR